MHSVLIPHCSNDDDTAWEPVDKNELEPAEPAEPTSNNAIDQMVLDEEDSPLLERFRCRRPSGSGSVRRALSYLQKSRVLGVL